MKRSAADAPLRVAAYCRVSTDKEDQRNSLAAQREFFLSYIREHPGWSLVGVFADEGLSGTSTQKRPQFTEMVRRAIEGEIDLVLTKEVSRFARNTVDTLQITRQLKAKGVAVRFLNDGIDTRESDGEFRLTIMASVAQEESRKVSERTRWGQLQAMRRGVVFGNKSIYGYDLRGGQLTVDPDQAQVVRRVFHQFLTERKGAHTIARELTRDGIPPPLRPAGPWSSTMVLKMLRNEKYTGDLLQKKYRTTDHLTHRKIPNDGAEEQFWIREHHEAIVSREEFQAAVYACVRREAERICRQLKNVYLFPAPFLSLMVEGCSERGQDISEGGKYNNYGIHGTGITTAVDSLAAIKKYIFEEKKIEKRDLIQALKQNFEGYMELRNLLRYTAPKMGNDDDDVDQIAVKLLDCFADALKGMTNDRGGIFRAGTGSAMYYVWHAGSLPATPDGRMKGEGFGCNYSPGLFTQCRGPVSVISSFAKPHLERVINGGPLTMELHDTVFRNEESIGKVALLVKSFFDLGGHQLQLNAVNRETLLDAQKHPERYPNLIVRVWGWSGYFVELDKVYQDHIIQRAELEL